MKHIKAVLFDLDHTLWDFEANSRQTIAELFDRNRIGLLYGVEFPEFISVYERINHSMWAAYSIGELSKSSLRKGRFSMTLDHFGIHDEKLAECLAEDYVQESPRKTNLFPFVHESLTYLKQKYKLGLITNGFAEVQMVKIRQSNLSGYFDPVVISEQVGFKKPDPTIFQHAASLCGIHASSCLMIGDNLDTDIKGALDAGMYALHFDPYSIHGLNDSFGTIRCLSDLKTLL